MWLQWTVCKNGLFLTLLISELLLSLSCFLYSFMWEWDILTEIILELDKVNIEAVESISKVKAEYYIVGTKNKKKKTERAIRVDNL